MLLSLIENLDLLPHTLHLIKILMALQLDNLPLILLSFKANKSNGSSTNSDPQSILHGWNLAKRNTHLEIPFLNLSAPVDTKL
mgnify:CR=1 FL=1